MDISFHDLLEKYSDVEVYLPKAIFDSVRRDYASADCRQKGIIVEVLFSLWLRRIYKDKSRWEYFKFDQEADFYVNEHIIDVKSSERFFYPLPDVREGKDIALKYKRPFNYVLVAVQSWDEEKNIVGLKVHDIIHFDEKGVKKRIRPSGAIKRFL